MFRKFLLLASLCGLVESSLAATFDGLPEALEAARQTPVAGHPNASVCHEVAGELVRLSGTYSNSSLVPEALFLAARLEKTAGYSKEALALSEHVVKSFPASENASGAFDLAWSVLTRDGADPMAGVDLARELATALGGTPSAGRYYQIAFNACRDTKHWQDALAIGNQYLKTCTATTPNPTLVLGLGDVALMAADTPLAVQLLEGYLSRYPKLPQIVAVRTRLGQMYDAVGNSAKAKEHYSLAWTTYQKNSRDNAYHQPEIAHAAAVALCELQAEPREEFFNLTAINSYLNKNRAKRKMENLINAYTQVMTIDQALAPQALNAIGDAHARYADALLKQGFQYALNSKSSTVQPPYYFAAPEYEKAVAAYSQAYERAAMASGDAEAEKFGRYAASRAFELTAGDGDAIFAWAIHLYEKAPQAQLGQRGNDARIAYLTKTVTPLLEEGLHCKTDALAMAKNLPVQNQVIEVQLTLDMPLRPMLNDLFALSQSEIHKVQSTSTELASSIKGNFDGTTTATLAKSVEDNFAYATRLSTDLQKTLSGFCQTFQQYCLPEQSLAFWNDLMATSTFEYATACRTMQEGLAVALGQLASKKDDSALPLYTRLNKLQSKGASEEFAGLVRWHDFARQYNIQEPVADRLQARLAELDPLHYGTTNDTNSASRKKP